jgi:hypothetical protein
MSRRGVPHQNAQECETNRHHRLRKFVRVGREPRAYVKSLFLPLEKAKQTAPNSRKDFSSVVVS